MSTEKEAKDLELKKHVGSIHCSNMLSLLQRKISNVLLYYAYDELLEKEEHQIPIKTLCSLIGYSSHDYDSIKRALKALISTVIEWNLLGDSKENAIDDWNASSILASVAIRGGICSYSYSHRLKKLLYMPEIYGRINIAIQARFKSNYALALYENCIRYRNLPHTRWFALATFRKLMGVPDDKYIIFRDFKRRVLDKSLQEINAYADIQLESEIEREGLRVNRIRFKIQSRELKAKQYKEVKEPEDRRDVFNQLINFGLTPQQATKLLNEYDPNFIEEKIKLIKVSHTYRQDKVHNRVAYLKSALRDDYHNKLPEVRGTMITSQCTQTEDNLRKSHADLINTRMDEAFYNLDKLKQIELKVAFENYLKTNNNRFILDKYHEKGFSNRIVKSMFRVFLKENYASLVPHAESFEEFKKTVQENMT